jgi:hypothetical protein
MCHLFSQQTNKDRSASMLWNPAQLPGTFGRPCLCT